MNRSGASQRKRKLVFVAKFFGALLFIICALSAIPMVMLAFSNPSTSNYIELNKANHNTNIQHEWIDLDQVSAYFPVAVIAAEDQTFPSHFGFDVKQIRLVIADRKSGFSRGASTITQQTVKNLFLWPDKSLSRKTLEAWLTIWMELILSKQRILELYINFAQFGTSVFGIEAASQYYFSISAKELTPRQSALIAASLPTPSLSNPAKPSASLNERAEYVQDQMPRVGGRRLLKEL